MFRASDFDYSLPAGQIAQHPLPDRAASRLLVLHRVGGAIRHAQFRDIVDLVAPEDVLVLNVSRVIPARLHGMREAGGQAEILLVRELPDGTWLGMGHPGGKLKPGRRVAFGDDSAVEIVAMLGGGLRRVKFVGALDAGATLAKYGEMPLPPYIRRPPRGCTSPARCWRACRREALRWRCSTCTSAPRPSSRSRWRTSRIIRCTPRRTR